MKKSFAIRIWGDYACFTRPELKSERVSYDVMTPSAAIGILSAIYWKPEICWHVDRIHVLNPIKTVQIRRNEVSAKIASPAKSLIQQGGELRGFFIEEKRQQRAATILRDVDYVVEAHFEVLKTCNGVNDEVKHAEIFKRRASHGQCFHQPYLGTREFPANFELIDSGAIPESQLPREQRDRALGLMLHEIVYVPDKKGKIISAHDRSRLTAQPHFFMAQLKNGILEIPELHQTLS